MAHPYIAVGFNEDSRNLINSFVSLNSIRFTDFSRLWRDMRFSFIFFGRERREITLFTEECFHILTAQLTPENSFSYKCGLIYTLYAMYMKQICHPKVKIRLTLSQFGELISILKQAQEELHLDVSYIFWNLWCNNAYLYVCHPTQLGPGLSETSEGDSESKGKNLEKDFVSKSVLKMYLDEDYIDKMTAVHEKYESLKESQKNPEIQNLKMVNTNLFKQAKKIISKFEREYDSEDFQDVDSSEEEVEESTVARRSAIRERQFGATATLPKSRRHRQVATDESSASPQKRKPCGSKDV